MSKKCASQTAIYSEGEDTEDTELMFDRVLGLKSTAACGKRCILARGVINLGSH